MTTQPLISTTLPNGVVISAPQSMVAAALVGLAVGTSIHSPPTSTPPIPAIGEMWPEQGGINLGFVKGENGLPNYYLILPLDTRCVFGSAKLGTCGTKVEGADHKRDGLANTKALAAAGSDLCKQILALDVDGHADFYLPSQFEAYLIYAYGQEHVDKTWHWTSTQSSAHPAFTQDFGAGYQSYAAKTNSFRARAVRRFVIS